MKFSCQSNELQSALAITARALSSRSTQPILEGILVEALETGLQLTASDGSFTCITHVNAEVDVEGEAVLPRKTVFGRYPQNAQRHHYRTDERFLHAHAQMRRFPHQYRRPECRKLPEG